MIVFVFSAHQYEIPFLKAAAGDKHRLSFSETKLSLETASLAEGFTAISIFTADDASAAVLERLKSFGVKYIALRSAGYDHVNLGIAHELGIRVANVPAYSPYSIAEHAVALLLALNRRIVDGQILMNQQDFRLNTLVGFDIHGRTVGILGTGTIGTAFASIMKGFGANVIACDPVQSSVALALGVRYVTLDELLATSDILSIHCPLNEKTRSMIAEPQLARMKKGAVLINTSRGAIINTEDVIESLEQGHLGGACLDVYEKERSLFFEDHRNVALDDWIFVRLRATRNVIVTGHQAFLTTDALTGIANTTIMNLDRWSEGKTSPNELMTHNS